MPSETRHPYVALTPNHADFALQPSTESSTAVNMIFPVSDDQPGRTNRLQTVLDSIQHFGALNAGLLLVTAAGAMFSLVNVAVKMVQELGESVSTAELIIVRMVAQQIFMAVFEMLIYSFPRQSLGSVASRICELVQNVPHPFLGPEGVRVLLVFRGLTGFVGMSSVYVSLNHLSLSDVTVLSFLVPMCTAMAGSLFLKETFTRREALAGLCSLFGVVLIARPDFLFGSANGSLPVEGNHRMFAIGISLLGVLGSTGAMTSIRAIGQRAHPMHLLAMFSVQSVIASSLIMLVLRQPVVIPTSLLWLGLLTVIGILAFGGQILLTMGFQRETAGRASMAFYTQIIFASVLERIFFHTVPTILSLLGTSIIMSSAIYVALTKKKAADVGKPEPGDVVILNHPDDIALEEGLLEQAKSYNVLENRQLDQSPRSSLSSDSDSPLLASKDP